jgi:hypothetical protein
MAIMAREASADSIHWTFAPMIEVCRDPRWGRIAESYGEDPFLASVLAKAAVRGLQGDDLFQPDKMAACAKHYVAYSGAEGGRDYNTVGCGKLETGCRPVGARGHGTAVARLPVAIDGGAASPAGITQDSPRASVAAPPSFLP